MEIQLAPTKRETAEQILSQSNLPPAVVAAEYGTDSWDRRNGVLQRGFSRFGIVFFYYLHKASFLNVYDIA
jgi:methylmalonyl-CoA mutase cobalamin-binding subunit